MSRFRLAPQANAYLDQIWHYVVRKSSQEMANRLIESLTDRIGALCSMPLAGRSRAEMAPGLRSFPCGEYVIYYRKVRGRIVIVRIIHGARDQKSAWDTPSS
jgi:toxin ParE1/3/4